ncbi:MAG: hypothetical protein WCV68_04565 [Candidatus Paceibacterota bacterium]|jgi:hypothetical protein
MKFQIRINDFENKLLGDLTQLGWRKADVIRMAIRLFHREEFGDLARKRAKKLGVDPLDEHKRIPVEDLRADDDVTEEEYCTSVLGGTVIDMEGVACCQYPDGDLGRIKPLVNIKKVTI